MYKTRSIFVDHCSTEEQSHDHISWYRKNSTWKILIPSGNKNSKHTRSRGNVTHLIKNVYKKYKADIVLDGEKLDAFTLRSGKRQEYLLSALLFNIPLETFAETVMQEQGSKRYIGCKGRNKTVLVYRWQCTKFQRTDKS